MTGARRRRLARTDAITRVLDVLIAGVGSLVLLPVFVVVAVKVRREFGSPVLFRQPRPGRDGEIFQLRKFRTMTDERGPDGELLPDDQRLTPFGAFLRSSSLDELPELISVLRGEMSMVGPRPLLVEYLELYSPRQARRHEVRPGLTGWSQINGRNDMSWPDKLALDVWYVEHRSVWLYVRIVVRTLWVLVTRQGVSLDGHATTVRFTGEESGSAADAEPGPAVTETSSGRTRSPGDQGGDDER
jgi:sugar transferase EpsL